MISCYQRGGRDYLSGSAAPTVVQCARAPALSGRTRRPGNTDASLPQTELPERADPGSSFALASCSAPVAFGFATSAGFSFDVLASSLWAGCRSLALLGALRTMLLLREPVRMLHMESA